MRREDIGQVSEIDREVFPTLWPPTNFRRELQNRLAHYIVAIDGERIVEEAGMGISLGKVISGLALWARRLFDHNRPFNNELLPVVGQYVVGFVGLWIMADEAHITSIAVRDAYQRQGIGEWLFICSLDLAMELTARILTLEVRASNTAAQSLYRKYGLTQVGVRRGYYVDNSEDGVLMSAENIASASFQAHLNELKQAHSTKWGIACYQIVR